ncbi:MAG: nicotinate-nucleotide adenylyltransferase [Candidatus Omnitrophota bacterium]
MAIFSSRPPGPVGVLGGTFNPAHFGHLVLAQGVKERLSLDKIIFIPTYIPPHKPNRDIAAAGDRYEMLRLAVGNNLGFCVSDVEINRRGKSYAIDTVRALREELPANDIFFIIGADEVEDLADWRDISELRKITKFAVVARPGYPLKKKYLMSWPEMVFPEIKVLDISAYEIRERIKQGLSARYLVPENVRQYILKKGLYRG